MRRHGRLSRSFYRRILEYLIFTSGWPPVEINTEVIGRRIYEVDQFRNCLDCFLQTGSGIVHVRPELSRGSYVELLRCLRWDRRAWWMPLADLWLLTYKWLARRPADCLIIAGRAARSVARIRAHTADLTALNKIFGHSAKLRETGLRVLDIIDNAL
jgi:hypothetical protein